MEWLEYLPPILVGTAVLGLLIGITWTLVRRRLDRSLWTAELAQSAFGRRLLEAREAHEQSRAERRVRRGKTGSEGKKSREEQAERLRDVLESLGCLDMLEDLRKAERIWAGKYRLGPKVVEARDGDAVQVGIALGWPYYTRDFDRYNAQYDFGVWAREEGRQVCVWVGTGPGPAAMPADRSILYTTADHDDVRNWVEDRLLEAARDDLWSRSP